LAEDICGKPTGSSAGAGAEYDEEHEENTANQLTLSYLMFLQKAVVCSSNHVILRTLAYVFSLRDAGQM
jgi:hypothetical protein